MGISGISTNSFTYYSSDMQIDLIIERGDRVVNICEIKYYDGEYTISHDSAEKMKRKISRLKEIIRRKYTYSIVMITAEGVKHNEHYFAAVQKDLTLDTLFR